MKVTLAYHEELLTINKKSGEVPVRFTIHNESREINEEHVMDSKLLRTANNFDWITPENSVEE